MSKYKFNVNCFTDIWRAVCDLATKNVTKEVEISQSKLDGIA
jgi:hypothetical protein